MGNELDKVQDTWTKARVTNQYTTARNKRKTDINQLLSEAQRDPDHENTQTYLDRVGKISSEDVTIEDSDVKGLYGLETDLDTKVAYTKLREIFRGKMITHQRGEIVKDATDTQERYINGDVIDRTNEVATYKNRLAAYKKAGYLTNEEYQSELIDMEDWEFNRAMRMVGEDPHMALEMIKNPKKDEGFTIKDKNQLNKLVTMANTNIGRQAKIARIATLQRQNTNQGIMINEILNDPQKPISEKVVLLNKLEMEDEISGEFATNARRYLTSVEVIDQEANHADMARVIRLMYDANQNYDDNMSEEQYLKSIKGIQNEIVSANGLTSKDRMTLFKELDNITKKKTAEASVALGKHGTEIYRDANTFFEASLPAYMKDEALRTFFYRSSGQNIDGKSALVMRQNIATEIMHRNRDDVQDAFDVARTTAGPHADLRLLRRRDGAFGIVWFKDGKPFRPVARVGKKPEAPPAGGSVEEREGRYGTDSVRGNTR